MRPVSDDWTAVAAIRQSVSPATTVCTVPEQVDPDAAGATAGLGVCARDCVGACVVVPTVGVVVVPTEAPAVPGAMTVAPAETSAWKGFRGRCVGTGAAAAASGCAGADAAGAGGGGAAGADDGGARGGPGAPGAAATNDGEPDVAPSTSVPIIRASGCRAMTATPVASTTATIHGSGSVQVDARRASPARFAGATA